MIVYRLCKSSYSNDLSGRGAELCGARWNSKGTPMVYTSQNRSLCTAEIAVHTPLGNIPTDYKLVSIKVPDNAIVKEIYEDDLPLDWNSIPHSFSTQKIVDSFISASTHLLLKVPSVIVKGEFNFLINPRHRASNEIAIHSIEDFKFDSRLFLR
jgi:RES domain-containing protein